MTINFRLDVVHLDTDNGVVSHQFPGPMTVLAGPVGVGKSTLLELVKHGLGGNALLAPVVMDHVRAVAVDIRVGSRRLRVSRSIGETGAGETVQVRDLNTRERLPDHGVDPGAEPSVNTLLMDAMGLPATARAATRRTGGTSQGGLITFRDIWSFMYVPQSDMSRDIAHSQDSYREGKRRAVFELLFGLTEPQLLSDYSELAKLNDQIAKAEIERSAIDRFLHDTGTVSRLETELDLGRLRSEEGRARGAMQEIHSSVEPADAGARVLQDLLQDAQHRYAEASAQYQELSLRVRERQRASSSVSREIARLGRVAQAEDVFGSFEFTVCPRCTQDITHRHVADGLCPLCTQTLPARVSGPDGAGGYERRQLADQLVELGELVDASEVRLQELEEAMDARQSLVANLRQELDARTREAVIPRLQDYEAAARAAYESRAAMEAAENTLRLWDRFDDIDAALDELARRRDRLKSSIESREASLAERRQDLVRELSDEFVETMQALNVPGVESVAIGERTYLPVLNGLPFARFSPAGGIRTVTQVAYWMTLLAVALRRRDTSYPGLLILDSPRLALGREDTLAVPLYRRLITLATASPDRVQFLVADNDPPASLADQFSVVEFSYEAATVTSVAHPGPTSVERLVTGDDD